MPPCDRAEVNSRSAEGPRSLLIVDGFDSAVSLGIFEGPSPTLLVRTELASLAAGVDSRRAGTELARLGMVPVEAVNHSESKHPPCGAVWQHPQEMREHQLEQTLVRETLVLSQTCCKQQMQQDVLETAWM